MTRGMILRTLRSKRKKLLKSFLDDEGFSAYAKSELRRELHFYARGKKKTK